MPRTVPPGLLQSPYQCLALRVQRTDGVLYGLSSSPEAFAFGGLNYQAGVGADVANIASDAGTAVDNTEITTLLEGSAAYLSTLDVAGMRFEGSRWTVYLLDYRSPAGGAMTVARYRLQRVRFEETSLVFELRGLLSLLKTVTGRTWEPQCDVERFGDKRCDPSGTVLPAYSDANVAVSARISRTVADFANTARAEDFYARGRAVWTTGANAGQTTIVKFHKKVAGKTRLTWAVPPRFPVSAGDQATLIFGCDRLRSTCKTVINTTESVGTNIPNCKSVYSPTADELIVIAKPK